MQFQTLVYTSAEVAFRSVQNGYTKTLTASSIAAGGPVVLSTHTASNNGQFVQYPATSTSIVNNLYIGNAHAAIAPEDVGLVQVYGYDSDADVQILTTTQNVGQVLIPDSTNLLFAVSGPVTAAATSTAAHTEVPALGGLAILMEQIASSSATSSTTAKVFLRGL